MARLPRSRLIGIALARLAASSGGYFAADPLALRLGGVALAIAVAAPFSLWATLADDIDELGGCELAANAPIYTARDRATCTHRHVLWSFARGGWSRTCFHCNRELEGRPLL